MELSMAGVEELRKLDKNLININSDMQKSVDKLVRTVDSLQLGELKPRYVEYCQNMQSASKNATSDILALGERARIFASSLEKALGEGIL